MLTASTRIQYLWYSEVRTSEDELPDVRVQSETVDALALDR